MKKQKSLIRHKKYDNGLTVVKYDRKVFYDNLWHTDPELLESRGKVTLNDKVVALPFKKIFNYKENDTVCDFDKVIVAVEKVNGFMFHLSKAPNEEIKESLGSPYIKGTTGSLDSDFVKLAWENILKHGVNVPQLFLYQYKVNKEKYSRYTFIFEIKDNEKDPHIINAETEPDGVYLLGCRDIDTGELLSQEELDDIAKHANLKRPKWKKVKFGDLLEETKTVNHEGFVVYDIETNDAILKLKSPFYTVKKWFMRRNNDFVFRANYKQLVDEEYYGVIRELRNLYSELTWTSMSEQEKGIAFENAMNSFADEKRWL